MIYFFALITSLIIFFWNRSGYYAQIEPKIRLYGWEIGPFFFPSLVFLMVWGLTRFVLLPQSPSFQKLLRRMTVNRGGIRWMDWIIGFLILTIAIFSIQQRIMNGYLTMTLFVFLAGSLDSLTSNGRISNRKIRFSDIFTKANKPKSGESQEPKSEGKSETGDNAGTEQEVVLGVNEEIVHASSINEKTQQQEEEEKELDE